MTARKGIRVTWGVVIAAGVFVSSAALWDYRAAKLAGWPGQGVSAEPPTAPSANPSGVSSAAVPAGRSAGPVMPDFALPDATGMQVSLTKAVGGRPFVVSFTTTVCPTCVMQLRALKQVRERLGQKVEILLIHVGETAEQVAPYIEKQKSPFTTLLDRRAEVYLRYGSGSVPLTIVGDKEGRIIARGNFISADQLRTLLEQALQR